MSEEIKEVVSVNRDAPIYIYLYDTPEDVAEAIYGPLGDIADIGGFDAQGGEYHLSVTDMITNITSVGCWGFCDNKQNLHVWVDKESVDFRDLIQLLAHEYGHIKRPHYNDPQKEEMKAEGYSEVTLFAYDVATKLLAKGV